MKQRWVLGAAAALATVVSVGTASAQECGPGEALVDETCGGLDCGCADDCASDSDCNSGCCSNLGYCAPDCVCFGEGVQQFGCGGTNPEPTPTCGAGEALVDETCGGLDCGCADDCASDSECNSGCCSSLGYCAPSCVCEGQGTQQFGCSGSSGGGNNGGGFGSGSDDGGSDDDDGGCALSPIGSSPRLGTTFSLLMLGVLGAAARRASRRRRNRA